MKLLTVIGARPQIIKAAAISRAIANGFSDQVEERILHTGQHYDANMSQVFFDELGIPQPHYNLKVGSGRHGAQTAKMISGIEEVLMTSAFDGVILYGDTNSTLAGAVAASKLHVPVYHIEAGLRSFNMTMPEEINRIVCDQLSNICFAPTQTAVNNLRNEGFMESHATFAGGRHRKVCNCGDVMYDNSMYFATLANQRCHIINKLGLQPNNYILATIQTGQHPGCVAVASTHPKDASEYNASIQHIGVGIVCPQQHQQRQYLCHTNHSSCQFLRNQHA